MFGYGNPSRGDDALGPMLTQALETGSTGRGTEPAVDFLTDFQLQVEHALDLAQRRLVLFTDAHVTCPAPFTFTRLQEARDDSYTTHAMSPSAILHVYRKVCKAEPPPSFLLSIRGERFELGQDLSPSANVHLVAAVQFARGLLRRAMPEEWQRRVSTPSTGEV